MHKQNHRNEGKLAVEQGREYWAPWIPPPEHLSSALLHPPTHSTTLNLIVVKVMHL